MLQKTDQTLEQAKSLQQGVLDVHKEFAADVQNQLLSMQSRCETLQDSCQDLGARVETHEAELTDQRDDINVLQANSEATTEEINTMKDVCNNIWKSALLMHTCV